MFPRSGACDQIPGAPLQRGSDPQRDERSGEEEHSQDPRLILQAGLLVNITVLSAQFVTSGGVL